MYRNEYIHIAMVLIVLVFAGERSIAYFIKRLKKKERRAHFSEIEEDETAEEQIKNFCYRVLGSIVFLTFLGLLTLIYAVLLVP